MRASEPWVNESTDGPKVTMGVKRRRQDEVVVVMIDRWKRWDGKTDCGTRYRYWKARDRPGAMADSRGRKRQGGERPELGVGRGEQESVVG